MKKLDNLLNQIYEDFEIICIKYGNYNKSINNLNKYSENDKRVIIFKINKKGREEPWNFGIKQAKGEYLLFLDINTFFEEI